MNRLAWEPASHPGGAFLGQVRLSGQPRAMVARSYTLGVTAQEWYERAKAAIAKYDFLVNRVTSIDNKAERENIITWLGDAAIPGTPAYRYASVKSDFTQNVAQEGVGAYNVERRQGRVSELEDYDKELAQRIETALKLHGTRLPGETRVETREVTSDLTWPIIGGAAVVTVGILVAALA